MTTDKTPKTMAVIPELSGMGRVLLVTATASDFQALAAGTANAQVSIVVSIIHG